MVDPALCSSNFKALWQHLGMRPCPTLAPEKEGFIRSGGQLTSSLQPAALEPGVLRCLYWQHPG